MNLIPTRLRHAWLLAFAALLPDISAAQSDGQLAVTVQVLTAKARLGDVVPIEVILRNTSERSRLVLRGTPDFNEAGGIGVVAIDANGGQTRLAPTPSGLTVEQARAGSRRIVLEPQTAVGLQRSFRVADLFPRAGRYEIIASYASPLPTEIRPGLPGEVEGSLGVSTPLVFEVTP